MEFHLGVPAVPAEPGESGVPAVPVLLGMLMLSSRYRGNKCVISGICYESKLNLRGIPISFIPALDRIAECTAAQSREDSATSSAAADQ